MHYPKNGGDWFALAIVFCFCMSILAGLVAIPILIARSLDPLETSTGATCIRRDVTTYEHGAAAFRAGIPAHANPYVHRSPMTADVWLTGWTDAKLRENLAIQHRQDTEVIVVHTSADNEIVLLFLALLFVVVACWIVDYSDKNKLLNALSQRIRGEKRDS